MATMIITDSTANLDASVLDRFAIKVVPLNVHLPDVVFKEGELSNTEYYRRLREEKFMPRTSQPSPADFLTLYKSLRPEDNAMVILISSKLSGTVQSAQLACEMFAGHERIKVIDSYSAVMGLGFQVIKAAQMAAAAKTTAEIEKEIFTLRDKMQIFFVVDNLEYLLRGGRISQLSSFIGSILKVKPVLNLADGQIGLYEKVRTHQKAVDGLINRLKQDIQNVHEVAVVHVDAQDEAELLAERVKEIFPHPIISHVNPVIGSHVGPGTLGLIYY
mgnify:FL=1|jgi:DegV family protein with EDD domain